MSGWASGAGKGYYNLTHGIEGIINELGQRDATTGNHAVFWDKRFGNCTGYGKEPNLR